MKKRILALLLCILMLLPLVLTSCGEASTPADSTEEEEVYVKPASLNFYIIGDRVSEEAEELMEAAFNKRAKELYKTQVDFIFCTPSEYESVVLAKLEAAQADEGKSAAEKYQEAEIETSLDELNTVIEHYPEIYDNQVDIVLITNRDMYNAFRPHLTELTPLIETSFRDIPQRVNSNLIDAATVDGKMFAVPNNVLIGTYEYVLVNKEIAYLLQYVNKPDAFYTTIGSATKKYLDYAALLELAEQIQTARNATVEDAESYELRQLILNTLEVDDFYPMNTTFDFPTVAYMPKEGENTIFGVVYDYNSTYTNLVELVNVFSNKIYKDHFSLMLEAKANGFCPTDATLTNTGKTAYGIMYLEGSYTDRFAYQDDYFVFEVDQPRLEDDGAYNAMFAVPSYSADAERAMEIVSALVAEDEDTELRNILQYGVENIHYTVDVETQTLERTHTGRLEYMMNANYTGNIITAYACPEDGRDLNYASHFKTQNDAAIRNPLYGLDSKALWKSALDSMVNLVLVEKMVETLKAEINALPLDGPVLKNVASQRAVILQGIPSEPTIATLRDYWEYIRAGYDPTLTYDETTLEEIAAAIRLINADLTKDLLALQTEVKKGAEEFLLNAAEAGQQFMDRALECETAADLEAVCSDITARDPKAPYSQYLYADRSAQWGTGGYIGALIRSDDYPMSLASALFAWWQRALASN